MNRKTNSVETYADIIDLPHHISKTRPQMSMQNRAAQFAPFSALSGYEAVIAEAGRLTQEEIELDEDSRQLLDREIAAIRADLGTNPSVSITYFRPDGKKAGGEYVTACGIVRKVDEAARSILLRDGTKILTKNIVDIHREKN